MSMGLIDSAIYRDDISKILADKRIAWEKFRDKSFLITGATGLIGSLLTWTLMKADERFDLNIELHIVARSVQKCKRIFGENVDSLDIIHSGVENLEGDFKSLNYIVHAASSTSSSSFVETPVEVLETNVIGTMNLLRIARRNRLDGFLYLSTIEVYGLPHSDDKIYEGRKLSVDPTSIRNSYPISKILSENLCVSYAEEYGVPVRIARLTQTFGPGTEYADSRVFAYFARCAVEGEDIVLKTRGDMKRNYLYTVDAVRAMLMLLLYGDQHEPVYNVCNENTYCSIREMAELVAEIGNIGVKYELNNDVSMYLPSFQMNLSADKLNRLGWTADVSLKEMYRSLISFMQEGREHGEQGE